MKQDVKIEDGAAHVNSGILYDRLERAIIALEYALADARRPAIAFPGDELSAIANSLDALQSAGDEVQEVVQALKSVALGEAAAFARRWG